MFSEVLSRALIRTRTLASFVGLVVLALSSSALAQNAGSNVTTLGGDSFRDPLADCRTGERPPASDEQLPFTLKVSRERR